MAIHYTQEFKEDAVVYYNDHKDLGLNGCAKNLGISKSALSKWVNAQKNKVEKYQPGEQVITQVMKLKK